MTHGLAVQRNVEMRSAVVSLRGVSYKLAVLMILRESDWSQEVPRG